MKTNSTNKIIADAALVAFAYISPRRRSEWLRLWRGTASKVSKTTLKQKINRSIRRLEIEAGFRHFYKDNEPNSTRIPRLRKL